MGCEGGCSEKAACKDVASRLAVEFREVLPRISRVADETRRYLLLLAWLNTRLEDYGVGRIIVTGGFAVEVYTGRVYRTMDIDVIVEGVEARCVVEEFLKTFSERIGRGYLPRDQILALKSIDIVGVVYDKPARPVVVRVDSYRVYMEAPEELVIRYLSAWKHWGSLIDRDKALWLYIAWRDRLDMDYLEARAREEDVEDRLVELENYYRRFKTMGG